ncbi:hypothetical protein ACK249_005162 [Pseudomonas aeruginosa]|nr:hypothetical protein [Pseudomonas aeruginosa]NRC34189.1 hypothetical protein [Pseudomonas aeruginosa]
MNQPKPKEKQVQQNRVVQPMLAYSDDSFVRMMSEMVGLNPKAGEGKKK